MPALQTNAKYEWNKIRESTDDTITYRRAVRNNLVPLPWQDIAVDKATRVVKWKMGEFDLSSGPNPQITANGYNVFQEMANDRPILYVITDQTMTGSSLYDGTRGALKIEGTNRLAYACEEYAVFCGEAKDIDASATKIDATWSVKVWYDGFVESECTFHPRDGVEFTIRYMWIEFKFNHEMLPYCMAPFAGHSRGACRSHTDEGFSWVETDMVDSTIKRWRTWSGSHNYAIGERVIYNGRSYECLQAHTNQTPSAGGPTAYWTPSASGYGVQPHDFGAYDIQYPTTLTKFHLWMGSAVNNAGAGSGNPATLYNSYTVTTYKSTALDPGQYDTEGGLQEPWFQFHNVGEGDRNSASDRGFWFGLESDANHRNMKACSSEGNRAPKVHMFFDDASSKVATVRIDFIGGTGVESNPTTWANSNANAKLRWDEDAGYNVTKASNNAPLRFEWFWHSLPARPRNSVDWRKFRMSQRWTVEAINYGSGEFADDIPSQHGHTPMSSKPMIQLVWNYLEWKRRGIFLPDHDIWDQHVKSDSADGVYAAAAMHFRDPAKDLGAKLMLNITLLHTINFQSTTAGVWPPTIGGAESHRRYPLHPLMHPYNLMDVMRLDIGKPQLRTGEADIQTTATNSPMGMEHWVGHPIVRQYLIEECWHALQNPEIGAIYYDNFNVLRMDSSQMMTPRWVGKDRFDIGTTGSGTSKYDATSSGETYVHLQASLSGIKGSAAQGGLGAVDAWGESYTVWPIRANRDTIRELYRLHEAADKPLVAHHFGASCPPLDSHAHYLVFGEELLGGIGMGNDELYRASNTLPFTKKDDPYDFVPAEYWLSCWATGAAPLFLPQFGRMIQTYRPHAHSTTAWTALLAKLNQYEIGLAGVGFYVTGDYNAGNAYVVDNVVVYQGNVYVCKTAHGPSPSRLPTDTVYWTLMGSVDCPAQLIHDWMDQKGTWRE